MPSARKHVVRRYGKAYQLRIESEEDLAHLGEFGVPHWIATAAPVTSFQCDPRFLTFLDTDANGRIRADEVLAAKRWLFAVLKNRSRLVNREDRVFLDDLDPDTPEGKKLYVAALRLLRNLKREETSALTLADVRDKKAVLTESASNGDGVIPSSIVGDAELAAYIEDIIRIVGGADDVSGVKGVSEEQVKRFHTEAEAYVAWAAQSHIPDGETSTATMPFGTATPELFGIFSAIRGKVDEYFAQCRLVLVDPATAAVMRLPEAVLKEAHLDDVETLAALTKKAPLQTPNPDEVLHLTEPLNAAFAEAVESLRKRVLEAMRHGDVETLHRAEWLDLRARFAPYEKWLSEKKGAVVEPLGFERLQAYTAGAHRQTVMQLIEADKAVAKEIAHVEELERLLLYQHYFVRFLNNFVNLSELYDPDEESMVDMGSLIMDRRVFSLALRVQNRPAHVAIARMSGMFLLYLEVTSRRDAGDRFEIVCPVTKGSAEALFVGKRGVFVDSSGVTWDAKIVEVLQQPVSIRQAVTAPFRRAMAFVEGKVEGLSTAREREWETSIGKTTEDAERAVREQVTQPVGAPQAQAGAPRQPGGASSQTGRRDMLIAGSVAVAALGSAWAFIAKTLTQLGWIEIVVALIASALVVILPTSVVAVLKLRRRNLGVLFEASEWAMNEQLRVTRSLARLFTERPKFPSGTFKMRRDRLLLLSRMRKDISTIMRASGIGEETPE